MFACAKIKNYLGCLAAKAAQYLAPPSDQNCIGKVREIVSANKDLANRIRGVELSAERNQDCIVLVRFMGGSKTFMTYHRPTKGFYLYTFGPIARRSWGSLWAPQIISPPELPSYFKLAAEQDSELAKQPPLVASSSELLHLEITPSLA